MRGRSAQPVRARASSSRARSLRTGARGTRTGGHSGLVVALSVLVGLAGVTGAGYLYFFDRDTTELSGATGCPVEGPPARLLVLVDTTNPMGPVQASRVRREIEDAIAALPAHSYVAIGKVDAANTTGALFAACRPPTASETSQLTANPRQQQRRYEETFGQPVQQHLDAIVAEITRGSAIERLSQDEGLQRSGSTIRSTETELVVTLPESITFAVGQAELSPSLASHVEAFATALSGLAATSIEVIGHTDSTGDRAANQALSERRADAVAQLLVAKGVAADRIAVRGAGPDRPVADNATSSGRALNRRVEIVLSTSSPIMESVQALVGSAGERVAVEHRAEPMLDSRTGQKLDRDRLLIISDLLQNSDVHSFYRGQDWSTFASSPDLQRLSKNMSGITVVPYKLARRESAIIDADVVEDFWVRYFEHQGVSRIEKLRIIGDL